MDETQIYGPPGIETPNIEEDIRRFFCPEATLEDAVRMFCSSPTEIQRKLRVVAERLEFVEHLLSLRSILVARKTSDKPISTEGPNGKRIEQVVEHIRLCGREFDGVDHDIEALCLYLLLTCIDAVVGKKRESERRFKTAIKDDLSPALKERFVNGLAAVQLQELQDGRLDSKSWQAWGKKEKEQRLGEIADSLWKIRNGYTHNSHRTFAPSIPIRSCRATDEAVLIDLKSQDNDFLSLLQDMVKCIVRKHLLGLANESLSNATSEEEEHARNGID